MVLLLIQIQKSWISHPSNTERFHSNNNLQIKKFVFSLGKKHPKIHKTSPPKKISLTIQPRIMEQNHGKYLLMDSQYETIKIEDRSQDGSSAFYGETSRVTKKIIDIERRISTNFRTYSILTYINMLYFIGLSGAAAYYIFANEVNPSIPFWVIFMIRNVFILTTMVLAIKAKARKESDYQFYVVKSLIICLVLSGLRWSFASQWVDDMFGVAASIPWPAQWADAIFYSEFFLSVIGISFMIVQGMRLSMMLRTKEELSV